MTVPADRRLEDRLHDVAAGAVDLLVAGAPRVEVEVDDLVRVTVERLPDRPFDALPAGPLVRHELELTEVNARVDRHRDMVNGHTDQIEALERGNERAHTAFQQINDRLDGSFGALRERLGIIEERIGELEEVTHSHERVVDEPETIVMGPEQSEDVTAELLARSVLCPVCGVAVGEPCVNLPTQDPREQAHDRRLEAARAYRDR